MWDRCILGYNFGEIPALGILKKKGYQHYLSVETLNEDLSSWEMNRVVKESKEGLDAILEGLD